MRKPLEKWCKFYNFWATLDSGKRHFPFPMLPPSPLVIEQNGWISVSIFHCFDSHLEVLRSLKLLLPLLGSRKDQTWRKKRKFSGIFFFLQTKKALRRIWSPAFCNFWLIVECFCESPKKSKVYQRNGCLGMGAVVKGKVKKNIRSQVGQIFKQM